MFLKKRLVDSEVVTFLEGKIDDSGKFLKLKSNVCFQIYLFSLIFFPCSFSGAGCQEILIHFSKLFPAQLVCKGAKGKHWTASKEETQEGFLKHVLSRAQMNDFLVRRKAKFGKFSTAKKPLSVQPICIVVGPSISQIESSYCVVANETYKLDSPLEAIDTTFKILHTLDLGYSKDALVLWRFLQHAVYKVSTPRDDDLPCLPALLKMFEKC